MKKTTEIPDVQDEKLGLLLRAAIESRSRVQMKNEADIADFTGVFLQAEADARKRKKPLAAFRILPAVAAAAFILILAPKANPGKILPDFSSAVAILSRESVMDENWNAGSLRGDVPATGDETISLFIEDLWNREDIRYD